MLRREAAASLLSTALGTARRVANGLPVRSDHDTFTERVATCMSCPAYREGAMPRCAECGCLVYVKARVAASTCPRDLWVA